MINAFRKLYSTTMPKPKSHFNKIAIVYDLLRNVFQSRSHQSFEMKTWKAYLDLGSEKVRAPPGLFSQILIFISANNIFSQQHKKLAFRLVSKDIQLAKAFASPSKPEETKDYSYISMQAKIYQCAYAPDGAEKSVEYLKEYLQIKSIGPITLGDLLSAVVYVRIQQNGVEDTVKWMEQLLETEWQTPNGPIKIPWDTRACKIIYKQLHNSGLNYENFLSRCEKMGIHFDTDLVNVRKLLRADDLEGAIIVAEGCVHQGPNTDSINELIGNYIFTREMGKSKILNRGLAKSNILGMTRDEIWEKGMSFLNKVKVKSTLFYNAILVFHLHNKEYGLVTQKYEEFLNSGFQPDIKSLTVFIQALFILNKIKAVDEVLESYTKGAYKIDSAFIQTVTTGYVRANFLEKANFYYRSYLQRGFVPSEKLYSSLICNYCHIGDLGTASQLYEEYLDRGFKPTDHIIVAFIKGYGVRGDFDSALSVFNSMESVNLVPNIYTYNSLIKIFIKANRKDQVLNLFEQMKRQGVEKNRLSSFLMVNFQSKFGTEEEMLQACKDHHLNGYDIDEHCLLRLVEFYCRQGNVIRALEYANRIAHLEAVERPSYAHNVILKHLKYNSLNLQTMIDYMNDLLLTDIPDCKTFELYITILASFGRFELMENTIENEVLKRVKPDQKLIHAIIKSYWKADNKKKCLDWYTYLQRCGMTPSHYVRSTMALVEKMNIYQSRTRGLYVLYKNLQSRNGYNRRKESKIRRAERIKHFQNALQHETNPETKKRYAGIIRRLEFRDLELANRRFKSRMILRRMNRRATLRKSETAAYQLSQKLPSILDSYKSYQAPFAANTEVSSLSKVT